MNQDESSLFDAHIKQHVGEIAHVISESYRPDQRMAVYVIEATESNPSHTLVTSGMSQLPMNTPAGSNHPRHIELVLTLPKEWRLPKEFEVMAWDNTQEAWQWPFSLLLRLAHYPKNFNTWLGQMHTISNEAPFAPDTKLSGVLLLPPIFWKPEFHQVKVRENKIINFLCVIPIYQEEMDLKRQKGIDALLTLFQQHQIGDVINPQRINVVLGK